jgi:hypothetical protein
MSSRPKRLVPHTTAAPKSDSDDDVESREFKAATAGRKAKQKQVRGVRGKLRMLTEMPIDVLFEVNNCIILVCAVDHLLTFSHFHIRFSVTWTLLMFYICLEPQNRFVQF